MAPLGAGKDGVVFSTSHGTALKFHANASVYRRERDAYLRLREKRLGIIHGFNVPILLSHHDSDHAIEISIVRPPYLLDFASVRVDEEVTFDSDAESFREQQIIDLFGERATDVFLLLADLREKHGVDMLDARPSNINFGD